MECLQLARAFVCGNYSLNKRNYYSYVFNSSALKTRTTSTNASFTHTTISLATANTGEGEGAFSSLEDEPPKLNNSQRAMILTKETDSSGFPIGFHFVTPTGSGTYILLSSHFPLLFLLSNCMQPFLDYLGHPF